MTGMTISQATIMNSHIVSINSKIDWLIKVLHPARHKMGHFSLLVLKKLNITQQKHTHTHTQINYNAKLEAKDVLPNINRTDAAEWPKKPFFVPGDLDLQTHPSEGPNTASMVNHSAVPEVFHTQTKNHRLTAPKTEPSAVHCMP